MNKKIIFQILMIMVGNYITSGYSVAQPVHTIFQKVGIDSSMGVTCFNMLCTSTGQVLISSSSGLLKLKGRNISFPAYTTLNPAASRSQLII